MNNLSFELMFQSIKQCSPSRIPFIAFRAGSPSLREIRFNRGRIKNTIELYMWTVYLLLCDQKIIYTGLTDNFERRYFEHTSKTSRYTKQFSDLKLIHKENYNTEAEAVRREKEIKGWSRNKKLALLK